MRKRLVSAKLFDPETGEPFTDSELRAQAETQLGVAVDLAGRVVDAHVEGRLTDRQKAIAGRAMGTAALYIATLPISGVSYSSNPYEASIDQRDRGLAVLGRARSLVYETGSNATVAQFPDENSGAAVLIRRTAPDVVYNAFGQKVEELQDDAA
jgi:hypothetical protein